MVPLLTNRMSSREDSLVLPSVLKRAHQIVGSVLRPGDVAVDATAGNGHDTVRLARSVGRDGQVYGFDVQEEALRRTRERLEAEGMAERVTLFQRGHETMRETLPEEVHGQIHAVMFNLGYLPGSDKICITRPETTIPALRATLALLSEGGVVTVVLYSGHEGGQREAEAVRVWMTELDQETFHVLSYRFVNQQNNPPELFVIEKR